MREVALGECCRKITDGSHNPPKGGNGNYLMLSSKNIHDDVINFEGARRLNDEEFQAENRRTDVGVGDVLMTIVGTIGRVAEVKIDDLPFTGEISIFQQSLRSN